MNVSKKMLIMTVFAGALLFQFSEEAKALEGDANLDCVVNFADFAIISSSFGATVSIDNGVMPFHDLDGNGEIGFGDFLMVASNFNARCPNPVISHSGVFTATGQNTFTINFSAADSATPVRLYIFSSSGQYITGSSSESGRFVWDGTGIGSANRTRVPEGTYTLRAVQGVNTVESTLRVQHGN